MNSVFNFIPSNVNSVNNDLISVFNPIPSHVNSPINIDVLIKLLKHHPDQSFVAFLVRGFSEGFSIGFNGPPSAGQEHNLLSARQNPAAVSEAIRKELVCGHTVGPFITKPLINFHCSPLGAVPKKDGTHRIILDLSSPRRLSINEGISPELYTVKYSSFDEAANLVAKLGKNSFMAKLDIKHAFRLCPVRPSDWPCLGYFWQNHYYFDIRLPFGSRSSPFIFNQFAKALMWILITIYGVAHALHYLDDFFICAPSNTACKKDMDTVKNVFSFLGVPLAPDKIIGPATTLTYLDIEIDSIAQTIQLPKEKYDILMNDLTLWSKRKKCTKRELLSLIGSLSFVCKVIKPGQMFLRRLIDLSTAVSNLSHHISLNSEAQADISWWIKFLPSWNGREKVQAEPITLAALKLYTDASNKGLGTVYGNHWMYAEWPDRYRVHHINYKELFAVVACVFTWGIDWKNKQIIVFTDNFTIVQVWKSGSCKDKNMMHLIRALFMFTAKHNINVLFQHIPGYTNVLADFLYRLQVKNLQSRHQSAIREPTPIAPDVWQL